jgi:hypothetical protein
MKGVLAGAIIALMTVTAYAQGMGGMGRGGKHRHGQERSVAKKKANDNAKSPLEQLPDKPYDPWRVVRDPVPAPK